MTKTEYIARLQVAMREFLDLIMEEFPDHISEQLTKFNDSQLQELNDELMLCVMEHTGDRREP